jgi:hypothetical protein
MARLTTQPGLVSTATRAPSTTLPLPKLPARPALALDLTLERRMFLMLSAIWLMHMLDLRFTLFEHFGGHFVELNPVGNFLLGHSIEAVTGYKLGTLAMGTTILWYARRHAIAVSGTWLFLATTVFLMVKWFAYYQVMPADIQLRMPPLALQQVPPGTF